MASAILFTSSHGEAGHSIARDVAGELLRLLSKAKVSQLRCDLTSSTMQEDVFWLHVIVSDAICMHIGQSSCNLLQDHDHPFGTQDLLVQPILHTPTVHLLDGHAHIVRREAFPLDVGLQLPFPVAFHELLLQNLIVVAIEEDVLILNNVVVTLSHLASIHPFFGSDVYVMDVAELQHRLLVHRSSPRCHHHPAPLAVPEPATSFQVKCTFQAGGTHGGLRGCFPKGIHGFEFLLVLLLRVSGVGRSEDCVPNLQKLVASSCAQLGVAAPGCSPEVSYGLLLFFREVVCKAVKRGRAQGLHHLS
mmetsp:Transcript_3650/g.6520  ORF Transcript_3650/g.6520 Transcript_3650/m.6520 type:complete len:304 (+) Transcript_3650:584-1495(+)